MLRIMNDMDVEVVWVLVFSYRLFNQVNLSNSDSHPTNCVCLGLHVAEILETHKEGGKRNNKIFAFSTQHRCYVGFLLG